MKKKKFSGRLGGVYGQAAVSEPLFGGAGSILRTTARKGRHRMRIVADSSWAIGSIVTVGT